jgi:hypothetical protein
MTDAKPKDAREREKSPNEGEGNRTAARQYNEATRDFVKSGKVDQQAEKARRDVEGAKRAELERAEKAGRERMKEEDPAVHRGDEHRGTHEHHGSPERKGG